MALSASGAAERPRVELDLAELGEGPDVEAGEGEVVAVELETDSQEPAEGDDDLLEAFQLPDGAGDARDRVSGEPEHRRSAVTGAHVGAGDPGADALGRLDLGKRPGTPPCRDWGASDSVHFG